MGQCSFRPGQILPTLLPGRLHWNKWHIQGIKGVASHGDSWSSPVTKCLKIKWMKFWTNHLSETHFYFNFVKDRLACSLVCVLRVSRCAAQFKSGTLETLPVSEGASVCAGHWLCLTDAAFYSVFVPLVLFF